MSVDGVKLFLAAAALGAVTLDDDTRAGLALFVTEDVTFQVTEKERVQNGDSSRFMVWADFADGSSEVFENTDSLVYMKFNSADVYGDLEVGACFNATATGIRWPLFSMNRNLIDVTPTDCPAGLTAPAAPTQG